MVVANFPSSLAGSLSLCSTNALLCHSASLLRDIPPLPVHTTGRSKSPRNTRPFSRSLPDGSGSLATGQLRSRSILDLHLSSRRQWLCTTQTLRRTVGSSCSSSTPYV